MSIYLAALALTIGVEELTAVLVLGRSSWVRVVPAVFVANLLSHPALHFLLPRVLAPRPAAYFVLVGELAVFLLEAVIYLIWVRPRPWPLAGAASAAANAASFGIGICIFPGPG